MADQPIAVGAGCRRRRDHRGLLLRHGFAVMNVGDLRTIGLLRKKLDPAYAPDPAAVDWHETEWYRGYFGHEDAT